jgi:hypothetical protein
MRERGILIFGIKKIDDGKRAWKQVNPEAEVFYTTRLAHMFLFVNRNFLTNRTEKGRFRG